MPILAHEPDIFPADLLDQDSTPPGVGWYVMQTLSRREKQLMRRLRRLQIAHYGPLTESRRRSPAGRIRTSYLPLFRGYVFLRGTEEQRWQAVSTGCVSNCMIVSDTAQLVHDLKRVQLLNQSGSDIRCEPGLLVGRRAIVVSGPMTGVEGIITRQHSQHRLTVMVTFMQQGASVTIDEADIELLD